ncbi:hypothetical protein E0700_07315 [Lactobacillus helveticus]|nr:hypothetical protein [Lactobacillus helveticus]MBW8037984.1 hypothetical protein [Lactobacillus helveticus]
MSRKSTYSFKQKKWAVEQYLSENMSAVEIARRLNMPGKYGRDQVTVWGPSVSKQSGCFLK